MTDSPTRSGTAFPEELLSGYLDGALTQQDEQRVRLHLERSPAARALYQELAAMREAGRTTRFPAVEDLQWSEAARTPGSALARRLGWVLVILCPLLWIGSAVTLASWEEPPPTAGWLFALVAGAGLGGGLLLLVSVIADRLRDSRGDRYRRVLK
jgi:anti-sigma factor RsiW